MKARVRKPKSAAKAHPRTRVREQRLKRYREPSFDAFVEAIGALRATASLRQTFGHARQADHIDALREVADYLSATYCDGGA